MIGLKYYENYRFSADCQPYTLYYQLLKYSKKQLNVTCNLNPILLKVNTFSLEPKTFIFAEQ